MSTEYVFPEPSEDQRMILDSVREFVDGELAGLAEKIDHEASIPAELHGQLAELGLLSICIPEEQGGAGFDQVSYQASVMEMAGTSAAVALHVALQTSAFLEPIASAGCAETSVFEKVAMGSARGALALQEDEGGWSCAGIGAELSEQDGKLVLSGRKLHVLGGTEADELLVLAREGDGHSLVVVATESAGVEREAQVARMGMRGVTACAIDFESVEVDLARRVGAAGQGAELVSKIRARLAIALAAIGAGIMRSCRDNAARYGMERRQFRRPIADFDAMRERIASGECGQAVAANLVFSAARAIDEGREPGNLALIAKVTAADAAMKAADDALQVYGGYGFSEEYPVERLYRDARYLAVALGGNAAMLNEIAGAVLPELD